MKWFRFYIEVLDDPKVQRLSPHLFKFWVNCLCLAGSVPHRGIVPSVGTVAFRLRISEERAAIGLDELAARGFLDRDEDGSFRIHNWHNRQFKSDDVSARSRESMRRSRDGGVNVHKNVTDTDTDTETETEEIQKQTTETDSSLSSSVFHLHENLCGTVSPLIAQDLMEMEREYPAEWLESAFQEAARANVRKLTYVKGILENWRTEGKRVEVHGETDTSEQRRQRADAYVEFFNNQRV